MSHATSALAHDDTGRLDLSPERARPGAALELHGVNIAPDQRMTLTLIGAAGRWPLGEVLGDAEGGFLVSVAIPPEAPAGAYLVTATAPDEPPVTAVLEIAGDPILEGDAGSQREIEEPLLAPMPTPATGLTSGSTPAKGSTPAAPAAIPSRPSISSLWLIPVGLLILVGLAVIRQAGRRSLPRS